MQAALSYNESERGRAPPVQQLKALLRKNVKERVRRPFAACCELCSPLLLTVVLVLGFNLSKIIRVEEAIYTAISLDIPGRFRNIMSDVGRLENATADGGARGAGAGDYDVDDADDVIHVFRKFMEGPFPIPEFDDFVSLGSTLRANLDMGAYEYLFTNNEAGREFGNLLTLGTLHFAPDSHPAIPALVAWLNATYPRSFPLVGHRLHASEAAAVDHVLATLDERTWAVVVVDAAEAGNVDYVLRLNFTTVPDTHYAVEEITVGLDSRFKRYYLSGYLTLQRSIDRFMFEWTTGASSAEQYVGSTFAGADATQSESMRNGAQDVCSPPAVLGIPFPTPLYDQNLFYLAVGFLLGLALTMSTLFPVSRLVKSVVEEKETRMTETMIVMGLQPWVHALSWWLTGCAVFAWIAVSTAAVVSATFFPNSDFGLLLVFFGLFALSEVNFAMLISTLFSKVMLPSGFAFFSTRNFTLAKLSAIVAPVALFVSVLPRYVFYATTKYEAAYYKYLCSLLSPTAFAFGADAISSYEYVGVGATWATCGEGAFSLASSMTMMAVDCVLYGLLALYLGQTWPREHGSPKHPLFCLRPALNAGRAWLAARRRGVGPGWIPVGSDEAALPAVSGAAMSAAGAAEGDADGGDEDGRMLLRAGSFAEAGIAAVPENLSVGGETPAAFLAVAVAGGGSLAPGAAASGGGGEQEDTEAGGFRAEPAMAAELAAAEAGPRDLEPVPARMAALGRVRIRGLRKRYADKVAVAGLDLTLYEGQITCLLGHNGAGKSTTIGMLTGLTPPTEGDCRVWGRSVVRELTAVRADMGVCPQQTVLFPLLTVREHLELFADIKGVPPQARDRAVWRKLQEVGLTEKHDTRSDVLSGGMKRKLQVAIAFTGSPRLVLLDEPSSGMDPYSRRSLWELLRRSKTGRVVLLTTHHLDEADVLGDRVAIMAHGRLRCAGSPLFLKSRFGLGYKLSLVRARRGEPGSAAAAEGGGGGGEEGSGGIGGGGWGDGNGGGNGGGGGDGEAFDAEELVRLVQGMVPGADLLSAAGGEVSMRLPLRERERFPALFRRLEEEQAALGVGAFGVSVTSLEEVFLSLDGAAAAATDGVTGAPADDGGGGCGVGNGGRGWGYGAVAGGAGKSGSNGGGGGSNGIELQDLSGAPWKPSSHPPEESSGQGRRRGDFPAQGGNEFAGFGDPTGAATAAGNRSGRGRRLGAVLRTSVPLPAQIREMLTKRWIVASRDPKGAFFQLALPLLVVWLVLALLSFDVDISGPSMTMDATMYDDGSQVLFSGPGRDSAPYPGIAGGDDAAGSSGGGGGTQWVDPSTMYAGDVPGGGGSGGLGNGVYIYTQDSTGLSRLLLDTIDEPSRLPRYAAFSFGDSLPLGLTVDWPWVAAHYEEGLQLLAAAGGDDGVLEVAGRTIDINTLLSKALQSDIARAAASSGGGGPSAGRATLLQALLNERLGDVAVSVGLPRPPGNEPMLEAFGTDPDAAAAALAALGFDDAAAAAAVVAVEKLTADDTGADVEAAFVNATGLDLTQLFGNRTDYFDVTFSDARLNTSALVLVVEDVSVKIGNESYTLGDVDLPLEAVAAALPPVTQTYDGLSYGVPGDQAVTLLHNSSSIHALPAWITELSRLQYRLCTGIDDAQYVHHVSADGMTGM
ncbi:unnamed protein product [Phaeothamnion confervicola]